MRVLVCGDREWKNYISIQRRIIELGKGTTIIQGEARGADRIAKSVAYS